MIRMVLTRDRHGELVGLRDEDTELVLTEDTEDENEEQDCCCGCDPFPLCLHCIESTDVYTESDNDIDWPTDVTKAEVVCIGRGGNGGDAAAGDAAGGGGGGECARTVITAAAGLDLSVIVNDTANGFVSEFIQNTVTQCIANNGEDGADSPNGAGGAGGTGGGGDWTYKGGDGETGVDDAGSGDGYGGGGGGSGGSREEGVDGNLADGGRGGISHGGDGANEQDDATEEGGGGGGGYDGSVGGNKGQGKVVIEWWGIMTMTVQFSGGPNVSADCLCETGSFDHVMWDNISESPLLFRQVATGDGNFEWEATIDGEPAACADIRDSDAILVQHYGIGECDEEDEEHITGEAELWVKRISLVVECLDGRMFISNFAFECCVCSRSYSPEGVPGPWVCVGTISAPFYCNGVVGNGGMGEYTTTAALCDITGTMVSAFEWPGAEVDAFDCGIANVDCTLTRTPGTITGVLSC